jgi:hypothetical protein
LQHQKAARRNSHCKWACEDYLVVKGSSLCQRINNIHLPNKKKETALVARAGKKKEEKKKTNKQKPFGENKVMEEEVVVEKTPKKRKEPETSTQKEDKKPRFEFGNYKNYYSYRPKDVNQKDLRLDILKRELFFRKHCLDIGCNDGTMTTFMGSLLPLLHTFSIFLFLFSFLFLALLLSAKGMALSIIGIDIDESLIQRANQRLQAAQEARPQVIWPKSFQLTIGELTPMYPHNLSFIQGDYLETKMERKFDVITW